MGTTISMVLGAALCAAGLISCAWLGTGDADEKGTAGFVKKIGQNRRVVVLPFEGDEANPQLASKIRESFYSHFSPKKYYDVEPSDIDAMLDHFDALSAQRWTKLSPVELGRCFKADFLVYGRVLHTQRLFYIFYSQLAMSVEIRLVETRRGRTVWKTTVEKRLHGGEVPLHPLSLVPAVARTGFDVNDDRMQDLIERVCRELARRVPDPAGEDGSGFRADIQVASFSSGDRARQMADKLQAKGYPTRIERVRINGVDWHRVLVGPYGRGDAENTKQALAADPAAHPVVIYAR